MRRVGVGRVLLWPGGSVWIGRGVGSAEAHAHHAIQISLALTGRLRFRADADDDWREYEVAIVPSHLRHRFDGGGETAAQVFVEPETAQGGALAARFAPTAIAAVSSEVAASLRRELLAAFEARVADDALIALAHRVVSRLSGCEAAPTGADPRVTRAIEFVRRRLDSPVSLAAAAEVAHLSPGRFRHLFVAQTGIPFRAYLLWARVETAVGAGMRGLSWTEAAQQCGFADSAHLTRTCRRMFGISPSMLVRE